MDIWGTPVLADVEEIVRHLQFELHENDVDLLQDIKRTHNNIMVTCISHNDGKEKNPSLGIMLNDRKDFKGEVIKAGTCHCFTCGYKADFPTFVSNALGFNDRGMTGYKWVIKNFVSIAIEERKKLDLNMSREKDVHTPHTIVTDEQLDKYRYIHPYMYERGLNDKVINYFDVGYDKDANALTFPVHDISGIVRLIQRRAVYGKVFINDEGESKGNHVYALYQVYKNLSWVNDVYITESIIDALTLWTHRIPAVALMGARATERQIELMKMLPVRKYVIALDNDEAGEKGSQYLKEKLNDEKVLFRLNYPENAKDVNDLTEKQINSRKISIFY